MAEPPTSFCCPLHAASLGFQVSVAGTDLVGLFGRGALLDAPPVWLPKAPVFLGNSGDFGEVDVEFTEGFITL